MKKILTIIVPQRYYDTECDFKMTNGNSSTFTNRSAHFMSQSSTSTVFPPSVGPLLLPEAKKSIIRSDAERNADITKMVGWIMAFNSGIAVFHTDGKSEPVNILHLPKPANPLKLSADEWNTTLMFANGFLSTIESKLAERGVKYALVVLSGDSFIERYPVGGATGITNEKYILFDGHVDVNRLTWSDVKGFIKSDWFGRFGDTQAHI